MNEDRKGIIACLQSVYILIILTLHFSQIIKREKNCRDCELIKEYRLMK